jgi:hypothetical protein
LGKISKPAPVKLICGFIFSDEHSYRAARSRLDRRFGAADFESDPIPFTFTRHYEKEMGETLVRRFCSFRRLIDPVRLAEIKLFTNRIEELLSRDSRRTVNIDPGYVDCAKLVLASTKNFRHRIMLSRGIYGEVTLYYQEGSFHPGELTYPDYRTPGHIAIFNHVRERYYDQIKCTPHI